MPGAYFTGADNGDGTHKVAINTSGSVNGFTPATAPIVLPVNTSGYASQKPPTQYSYDSISDYMAAGFIYVHTGLRGKDSNSGSCSGLHVGQRFRHHRRGRGDAISREQMYEPLYHLLESQGGQGSSRVAPNWRIRTGITQGDAASTVEINLALALQALGNTKVDFATVWGQSHTTAERTGDGAANFIAWVKEASA